MGHPDLVYVGPGRQLKVLLVAQWPQLGTDYAESLAAYAALHEGASGSGMAALIDKVLTHTAPRLRPSTVKQYAVCAKQLKKMLAEFSPEQVQPKHIASIKVALASKPNFANRCRCTHAPAKRSWQRSWVSF